MMVGERLTMTDASSRGFERVVVGCVTDNGGVGMWRLLEAPTSVASERMARRADRRGSISSPFWEDCPPDTHPNVTLARLKRISGRTGRQSTVKTCALGSQPTMLVLRIPKTDSGLGLSTRGTDHSGRACSSQKSRSPAKGKDRFHLAFRRTELCASLSSSPQQIPAARYHAVHPGLHHRCTPRQVP